MRLHAVSGRLNHVKQEQQQEREDNGYRDGPDPSEPLGKEEKHAGHFAFVGRPGGGLIDTRRAPSNGSAAPLETFRT